MERIAKTLAQTPYRYSIKEKEQKVNGYLDQDDPFVGDEMDTQEPVEQPPRAVPGKKRGAPQATKYFAAGGPAVPNLSQRQRPRSRSRSPIRENRTNVLSPKKSLATPCPGNREKSSQNQTSRAALVPRDPNAVSTRSMRSLESAQSPTC